MVVGVGKPPTQLEAEAITERVGVAIHRPPNPWRKPADLGQQYGTG